MSKLIDALKATSQLRKPDGGAPAKRTSHEMTQEQLASIYFPDPKGKPEQYPMLVRVVEKPGIVSVIPWFITSVAFLITAFALFSTKKIFVDIKVIDEAALRSTRPVASREEAPFFPPDLLEGAGQKLALMDFVFEGAAKLKSSKDRAGLMLVNSSVAPFARAGLRLSPPMNFSGGKIVFYAKGNRGGENVAVALKDAGNVQAFDKGRIYPFPDALTTRWQRAEIPIINTARNFDAKNVTGIRFDFGSKDTDNKPGDTIFIKDLQVVP